jgi:hypothetical protein
MSDVESISTPPVQAPTATGLLGMLAERRAQIGKEQVLEVWVPRWTDPKVLMRFKPSDLEFVKKGIAQVERVDKESPNDARKRAEAELNSNADILINSCIEVVAMIDGQEYGMGPQGRHTRFDSDLGLSLGLPENGTARAVVRELFVTDADLLMVAKKLGEWSGYRENAVEESIAGES